MGEGAGGGERSAAAPPIPSFPHAGGRGFEVAPALPQSALDSRGFGWGEGWARADSLSSWRSPRRGNAVGLELVVHDAGSDIQVRRGVFLHPIRALQGLD
jgi:hypothetical protein